MDSDEYDRSEFWRQEATFPGGVVTQIESLSY